MISVIVWDMYLIKICHSSFTFRASKKSMGMEKLQNAALVFECCVPCSPSVFVYCSSKYCAVTGWHAIQHSHFSIVFAQGCFGYQGFFLCFYVNFLTFVGILIKITLNLNLLLLEWSFFQYKFHQFMSMVRVVLSILQCLFQSLSSVLFQR